jgi:hypothetical protein
MNEEEEEVVDLATRDEALRELVTRYQSQNVYLMAVGPDGAAPVLDWVMMSPFPGWRAFFDSGGGAVLMVENSPYYAALMGLKSFLYPGGFSTVVAIPKTDSAVEHVERHLPGLINQPGTPRDVILVVQKPRYLRAVPALLVEAVTAVDPAAAALFGAQADPSNN